MFQFIKNSKIYQNGVKKYFIKYNKNKEERFIKENANSKDNPICFLGDSITDYYDLGKYYPALNCYNRGISGNTTKDIINRLQISVFDLNPQLIILLIGTNDLMNENRKPEDIKNDYETILRSVKDHLPHTKVICQSVYPGWNTDKRKAPRHKVFELAKHNDEIVELNQYIKELAGKYHYIYGDIHSKIKNDDNSLINTYSFDGCHPNEEGYQTITKELFPIIKDALNN